MSSTNQRESLLSHTPEDLFLSLADHMLDGVIIIGWDGTVIFANRAAVQLMGLDSPEEGIGLSMLEFIHPDSRKAVVEDLNLIREGMRGFNADYRIYQLVTRTGKHKWVEVIGTQVTFRGQTADLVTLRDITARKAADEALRNKKKLYQSLMNEAPIGLCTIDTEGNILYVNQRFEEITGYPRYELLGRNAFQLDMVDDETRVRLTDRLNKRIQGGESYSIEVRLIRRDKRIAWLDVTARAITEGGKTAGFQVVGRDITQRKKAEEELRASEQRLTEIINFLPDATMAINLQGHVIAWNHAMEEMTGVPAQKILGKGNYEYALPFYGERKPILIDLVLNPCHKIMHDYFFVRREKEVLIVEWEVRNLRGHHRHLWAKASPIYDHNGTIVGAIESIRDITERKQMEEGLRIKDTAIATSINAIAMANLDGHLTYVNNSFLTMWGYGNESEVLDKPVVSFWHAEDNAVDAVQAVLNVGGWMGESKGLRQDGSCFDVQVSASIVKDDADRPLCMMSSFIDISARKKAEAALCMSEKKFRELAEMLPEPIYEIGKDGTFNYANRKALECFGYRVADFEAGISWQELIVPEDQRRVAKNIARLLKGNAPDAIEYTVVRKDGTRFPAVLRSAAIFDQGIPIGFRGFLTDISEQRRAEEERTKLEAQLQRARKMEALGALAGGVAHDLNNVLGGIVSYPELLLLQLPEDSPLRDPMTTIQQSGMKAAAIVNDLLTLARRGIARPDVINLNDLIVEQCRTPEHEKLLHFHQDVAIELCLDETLLNLSGSPVHLSKTIMNLISNAAEAMEDGGTIVVSTTNKYIDAPLSGYDDVREGDYVTLSVSDTGIGISPEDMDRIFEPFYTKKVMGRSGTGLGMAVVWGTVKDHDGYIDIKSTEGQGTSITLYFPATREAKKHEPPPAALDEYMGHGETILIVDDVAEQRLVGSTMLQKLGYHVNTVASGEEAVEYLREHSTDLVVLDMIMDPGIDGLETYKRILDINRNQKAIITSGYSESRRVQEAQNLGVGAYIKKPYLMEQLGRAVRTELDAERDITAPGQ